MNCFCTIITSNYYFYVKTLYDSLAQFDPNLHFKLLIVDDAENLEPYKNITFISLDEIKSSNKQDYSLIEQYEVDIYCSLRWSLKPLLLKHLLKHEGYGKAIFLDADLFFYNDPAFLFQQLDNKDVLITPHWRSKNPSVDSGNFDWLFKGGLYNAGFFWM